MRGNGTLNGKIREGRWGRFDRGGRCERYIKLTHRHLRKAAHNSLISGHWILILKRAKYGERFVNILFLFLRFTECCFSKCLVNDKRYVYENKIRVNILR